VCLRCAAFEWTQQTFSIILGNPGPVIANGGANHPVLLMHINGHSYIGAGVKNRVFNQVSNDLLD
jgi:hypothetical protein